MRKTLDRRKPGNRFTGSAIPAWVGTAAAFLVLAGCLCLGFWLRRDLVPLNDTFRKDQAWHYRMTRELVENGRIPEVDRLANWPQGRKVLLTLPTGMYTLTAWFHRLVSPLTGWSLRDSILAFTSLAGALIVIPVFLLLWNLWRSLPAALAGAFLAGIIPAHLGRSFCAWYHYEVFGSLLLLCFLAFFVIAVNRNENDTAGAVFPALVSAGFLAVAFATWRLSMIFLICLDVYLLAVVLLGKENRSLTAAFAVVTAVMLVSFLLIPYLSASHFIVSRVSVLTVGTLFLFLFAAFRSRKGGHAVYLRRKIPLLLLTAALLLLVARIPETGAYSGIYAHFKTRALAKLGFHVTPTQLDLILYSVQELTAYSLKDLVNNMCLSASFVFIVFAFVAPLFYRKKLEGKVRFPPAWAMIQFFTAAFCLLTLLARRNKIFLGPMVALCAGSCVFFSLAYLALPAKKKEPRVVFFSLFLLIGYLAAISWTAWNAWGIRTLRLGISPENYTAICWLEKNTPENAVILADWEQGYQIQTYAHRATVVDGLLESEENRKRIPEIAVAYFSLDEEDLYRLCRNYGADYVLFNASGASTEAYVANINFSKYLARADWKKGWYVPNELGMKTTVIRMVYSPRALKHFELCENVKNYSIFRVK